MNFEEILDVASAEAIACQLEPTDASTWRKICRSYSKKFNTPLPQVLTLNPEDVALHVFEDNLDERGDEDNLIEHLLDLIYGMSDPEYAAKREEEMEEFLKNVTEEEAERIREGRPIHPALRKDNQPVSLVNNEPSTEGLPKSGFVNLSHLDKDDNER